MESVLCEYLLDVLDDLKTEELKKFKWYLKNSYRVQSSDLEKAKHSTDTVDLMKKRFGPEEAVKIMVVILRKMNQNHLADQLEKKHKQAQAEGSIEGPDPAGASSELMKKGEGSQLSTCPDPRALPPSLAGLGLNESEERKRDVELLRNRGTDPRTRNDFLKYSHRITADLNTAHKHLRLSESNTVITATGTPQSYPDHPDRFNDYHQQVLCRESVCDRRCYWEIEWSGHGVFISVSYKSIRRNGGGDECVFGHNDQSWSLDCFSYSYSFRHNEIKTVLPVKPIISRSVNEKNHYRVGVYVDHSAGTLSFYSVSGDTMILIHTVQTTFTQPLYPGFNVWFTGSSVKLL
ncbi:tripartite motif-containing protein 16-like isoform X1 [Megalobrama amblycephala]|uniref:tripartite motif-containing protein 16-like isoform X1 n=1 Tax=Megalobrama amblycephala TaxID=75352 RepID=UPI0020145C59|nr:tripartite motif-containing protein 16-like isoform X1 [Megalobrama amblycephala]XP_048046270.1 tripartite motif-containing protein 16-like isoform X1 [Megalobrama amblycephala]XP_048046271.1 tripartite motif-containing protein 16-like isoform X1 [Megalobrama amblycephala]